MQNFNEDNTNSKEQAFDRALQKRLEGVEVPAPDLMDQIFMELADLQQQPKEAARSKVVLTWLNVNSFKVAAVAVILLCLGFGISYITRKPALDRPATAQLSGEATSSVDIAASTRKAQADDPSKDKDQLLNTETVHRHSGALEKVIAKAESASRTHVPKNPAAMARLEEDKEAGAESVRGAQVAPVADHDAQGLVALASRKVEEGPVGQSSAEGLPAVKVASTNTELTSFTKEQEVGAGAALEGVDQNTASDNNQTQAVALAAPEVGAINDSKQGLVKQASRRLRRPLRERRGLLNNLLQNVTRRAREFSDEVVHEGEGKTVIDLGIVAVTTYKQTRH